MKLIVSFLLFGLIAGCTPTDATLELANELEEIRKMEGKPIEPPPEFRVFEGYIYSSSALRSPFMPQVRLAEKPKSGPVGKSVTPNFDRPKEPLEDFGVDQLAMVGTIKRPDGPLIGLVQDKSSVIHQVRIGSYVGRNHGQVRALDDTKIELNELIPNGRDGWAERPRVMWIEDN